MREGKEEGEEIQFALVQLAPGKVLHVSTTSCVYCLPSVSFSFTHI